MGLPLHPWTLDDFLRWEKAEPERHEFYKGEIYAMVGASIGHHRVVFNLSNRIDDHLSGTACEVFSESAKLQLGDDGILYPDVMVTCGKSFADDDHVVTDPVLIIEVLSPSTSGYDKNLKFGLYRTLPSLREYVLIDPARRQVEAFNAAEDGAWLFTDQSSKGALTLRTIDLMLPFEAVFKGTARHE